VARVLRGARPTDIPVETLATLFLTVNLDTARAIGMKIPADVLERADRLID
jgi:putative ABC transport system substrate-binding protein